MQESRNLTRRNDWNMEEDGEGTKEHFKVNGESRVEKDANQKGREEVKSKNWRPRSNEVSIL